MEGSDTLSISIVWIRNDLRLEDNTALIEAVNNTGKDEKILLVFYLDPKQLKRGTYSHDYFFSALNTFYQRCLEQTLDIYFLYGDLEECFSKLIKEFYTVNKIYFNIDDSGYGEMRDNQVKKILKKSNVGIMDYYDRHIHSAKEILKGDGSHYKVFTPYYNKWSQRLVRQVQEVDYDKLGKIILNDFSGRDREGREKFHEIVAGIDKDLSLLTGETVAEEVLQEFVHHRLADYDETRDYPYIDATSRLSKFLSTGQLSVRKVHQSLLEAPNSKGKETFIKELAWRDFYNMIYHFYPNQKEEEVVERYRTIRWDHDERKFEIWKEGKTGFPIVDAAMRQLKEEGWMHNRLRMIVASFFTKDLLMDWRMGENYFSQMLTDYDSASNIGGWQWAASVGTDAVPYFRIFNPSTQSKKFDPEGTFIKKYVRELKDIPTKYIHEPFRYAKQIDRECGIDIEKIYFEPIVDHKEQRLKALELFGV